VSGLKRAVVPVRRGRAPEPGRAAKAETAIVPRICHAGLEYVYNEVDASGVRPRYGACKSAPAVGYLMIKPAVTAALDGYTGC
jgi:hypothetical protein